MAGGNVKNIVVTGGSSGLGFEAFKQLLTTEAQPHHLILGARNPKSCQAAYDAIGYDKQKHTVTILPLELGDPKSVRSFARQALEKLGDAQLHVLFLNAAVSYPANRMGPAASGKWCESFYVNYLSPHYLIHLLQAKLVEAKGRVVVVSSTIVDRIDTDKIQEHLQAGSTAPGLVVYGDTKFLQLLTVYWWRRQLHPKGCLVLAVSPGFVPETGLSRESDIGDVTKVVTDLDIRPVSAGGASVRAAITKQDFPEDPDLAFLLEDGEWWEKSHLELSLNKALQDKWSPSLEQIEKEEGLA